MRDLLGRLGFLPGLGPRHAGRPPEHGPAIALYDHGLAVELPPGCDADRVAVVLTDAVGRSLLPHQPERQTLDLDGLRVLALPLDPDLFARSLACRLTVELGGVVARRRFRLGPGLFSGRIDGIRDDCLTGWASPLFATASFELRLVVDEEREAPMAPDRFRPDLMAANRHGGWNGFALPLPRRALDGRPHRLAVQAGDTRLDFGTWAAKPRFNIDHVSADRLTGWYFEERSLPGPATLRIEAGGRTIRSLETHARADLAAKYGREAAFAFVGAPVEAGQDLVTGPDGAGRVIGRVVHDRLAERVDTLRTEARARLLSSGRPAESLAARQALRERLVRAVRRDVEPRLGFRRTTAGDGPDGPARATAAPGAHDARSRPVCAIVPVYRGLADLRLCLESLLPQLDPRFARAVVIDDRSPDPEITAYLAGLAAEGRPGLTVLANEANLGFVGTVNRAFALLEPGEDALLVNADTILPPGAVARLAGHCHARPGIASVTPMSNNATILSFPGSPEPNPPALSLGVGEIDDAFRALAAEPVEIPTGIGFCMYLHAGALAEVGPFSPEWGRGYCEEVDWSLAARDLGWIHLAAADTFVMHEGSVSFGVEERSAILVANHARLEALYPEYTDEVDDHIAADPFEMLRVQALARLMAGRVRRLTLHLTHTLGGGTQRYVDDLRALPRASDHEFGILSQVPVAGSGPGRLRLAFDGAGTAIEVSPAKLDAVLDAVEAAGIAVQLHVNARLGFESALLRGIAAGRRPYLVTLHDFQWYCPQVQLTDEREFYCGEPPPSVCQLCVRHRRRSHDFADQNGLIERDLEAWLGFNESFLRGAARLLAPSRDTAERYGRRLGLTTIEVLPHVEPPPHRPAAPPRPRGASGVLKVAVVGAIARHKGLELLVRLAEHAGRHRLPLHLQVVGYTSHDAALAPLSNVSMSGRYGPGELPGLLDAYGPDLVFLPSIWPETYSYVLSEVWAAGYPVAAFDLGAPAERIREAGGGVLIAATREAGELYGRLLAAREALAGIRPPPFAGSGAPTLESYYAAPASTA